MPSVTIKPGRVQPIWAGHPWVYAQAIQDRKGSFSPGCEVDVLDAKGKFLGRGLWSPDSAIAIRLFARTERPIDMALFRSRLESALHLRHELDLPNNCTTAYRWVYGEGDGLPGLIVDVFGRQLSAQLGTIGLWQRRAEIFGLLKTFLHPDAIYDRTPARVAQLEGFEATPVLVHGKAQPLRFAELNIRYVLPTELLQKTGYYCDQRPLREWLACHADGRRVLDTFSYVGALGMNAAAGGAKQVDCVERNPLAVETGRTIAQDNGFAQVTMHQADALEFLQQLPNSCYDLTVCDPPKLALNKRGVDAAQKRMRTLVREAIRVTAPGGMVVLSSCSASLKHTELSRTFALGALDAGRQITITHRLSQGPDHPVLAGFSEGEYLSTLIGRVAELS